MTAPSLPMLANPLQRVAGRAAFSGAPGGRILANPLAAVLPLCAGAFGFAGEVDVITTPAPARVVRLYERSSGRLIREAVTSGAGLYAFELLDDRRRYYIVALDLQPGGSNAAIADYLTPS